MLKGCIAAPQPASSLQAQLCGADAHAQTHTHLLTHTLVCTTQTHTHTHTTPHLHPQWPVCPPWHLHILHGRCSAFVACTDPHTAESASVFETDVCKHVLTGVPPHTHHQTAFLKDVCKHVLTGVPPHASPNCAFESQCKHPMPAKQHRLFQLDENSTYQTCHRTCSGASARQSAAEIAQTIPRRLHITGQHQNSVHPTFHSARFMTFNLFQHKRHQPPHQTLRTAAVCCARTPPHHRTASKLSTPSIPQRTAVISSQLALTQMSLPASPGAVHGSRSLIQNASTSLDSINSVPRSKSSTLMSPPHLIWQAMCEHSVCKRVGGYAGIFQAHS